MLPAAPSNKRIKAKIPLDVCAFVLDTCIVDHQMLKTQISSWITTLGSVSTGTIQGCDIEDDVLLRTSCCILCISTVDSSVDQPFLSFQCEIASCDIRVMYDGCEVGDQPVEDNETPGSSLYMTWKLPNLELWNIWETLMFESTLKRTLLNFARFGLHFSLQGVDQTLIAWNRLILDRGKRGKGLAQTLSLEKNERQCILVEVNSHSLFSKYFSESGKLVASLFANIKELLGQDSQPLVIVLVDEVESLAANRASAGSDPSDAVRVVNSLLTQMDSLKTSRNVILLATSNLIEMLDHAFIDRADLILFVPLPPCDIRFEIVKECIGELLNKKVLTKTDPLFNLEAFREEIAVATKGLSGRSLRKLPFRIFCKEFNPGDTVSVESFTQKLLMGASKSN